MDLREHASRELASGVVAQWAYFSAGDRRLFVVEVPSEVIDTSSLAATSAGFAWPPEEGAATVAVRSPGGKSVIVRSEAIETFRDPRSEEEIFVLAQRIAES